MALISPLDRTSSFTKREKVQDVRKSLILRAALAGPGCLLEGLGSPCLGVFTRGQASASFHTMSLMVSLWRYR